MRARPSGLDDAGGRPPLSLGTSSAVVKFRAHSHDPDGSIITERISTETESWGSKGQLVAPQPMAHVMARARRAITQQHGGISESGP